MQKTINLSLSKITGLYWFVMHHGISFRIVLIAYVHLNSLLLMIKHRSFFHHEYKTGATQKTINWSLLKITGLLCIIVYLLEWPYCICSQLHLNSLLLMIKHRSLFHLEFKTSAIQNTTNWSSLKMAGLLCIIIFFQNFSYCMLIILLLFYSYVHLNNLLFMMPFFGNFLVS